MVPSLIWCSVDLLLTGNFIDKAIEHTDPAQMRHMLMTYYTAMAINSGLAWTVVTSWFLGTWETLSQTKADEVAAGGSDGGSATAAATTCDFHPMKLCTTGESWQEGLLVTAYGGFTLAIFLSLVGCLLTSTVELVIVGALNDNEVSDPPPPPLALPVPTSRRHLLSFIHLSFR
jgi:hypothetical protein